MEPEFFMNAVVEHTRMHWGRNGWPMGKVEEMLWGRGGWPIGKSGVMHWGR